MQLYEAANNLVATPLTIAAAACLLHNQLERELKLARLHRYFLFSLLWLQRLQFRAFTIGVTLSALCCNNTTHKHIV